MDITRQTVEHIALLARLKLAPGETEQLAREMSSILGYIKKLADVDTSDIEDGLDHSRKHKVWAEDEPRPSFTTDQALSGAQEQETGYIKVPPIVG
ncbi:MAG: Asp-tRNA(Asn)/Glu-tRNA(Gln) amidotransferase subunit GatC [Planctomycetaceae bacterium]|nr:Asp-tRNA(Asn)/Glu-tRNA(Gln) amidotransferase subunit GatC [Planctomycetaceae bacterium]